MKNEELHRLVVQTSASYVYAQCIEQTHRAYPSSIKHATNVLSVAPPPAHACMNGMRDCMPAHHPHAPYHYWITYTYIHHTSSCDLDANLMQNCRATAYLAQRASVWHPCPIYPVTYYTNPLSARTLNNICRQQQQQKNIPRIACIPLWFILCLLLFLFRATQWKP